MVEKNELNREYRFVTSKRTLRNLCFHQLCTSIKGAFSIRAEVVCCSTAMNLLKNARMQTKCTARIMQKALHGTYKAHESF